MKGGRELTGGGSGRPRRIVGVTEGGLGNPSSSSAKRLERVGHTLVGCSALGIDVAVEKSCGARHRGRSSQVSRARSVLRWSASFAFLRGRASPRRRGAGGGNNSWTARGAQPTGGGGRAPIRPKENF